MRFLGPRLTFSSVGADIFVPYLKECQKNKVHTHHVRCDVRRLPFRPKSFDVVLCMEVLEHLRQTEGYELIASLEQIARRQVIITTPVGKHEQHEYDRNPYQTHHHIWAPADMKRLGYGVRGHGVRNFGGMSGIRSPLPRLVRVAIDFMWLLAGIVTYYLPSLAGNMVCIKDLRE